MIAYRHVYPIEYVSICAPVQDAIHVLDEIIKAVRVSICAPVQDAIIQPFLVGLSGCVSICAPAQDAIFFAI